MRGGGFPLAVLRVGWGGIGVGGNAFEMARMDRMDRMM